MLALALGYSEFINVPDNSYAGYIGFGYDASKERFWKIKAAECGESQAQVDLALDYKIDGDVENGYDHLDDYIEDLREVISEGKLTKDDLMAFADSYDVYFIYFQCF